MNKQLHKETKILKAVNINRFKEGARVIEDVTRFILQDNTLFLRLKSLKHKIKSATPNDYPTDDLGDKKYVETQKHLDLFSLLQANIRRMQESARVLEEIEDRHFYKTIRFEVYQLNHLIHSALSHYFNKQKLNGLYPICNPTIKSIECMADLINQVKINLCQLRMKGEDKQTILQTCKTFRQQLNPDTLLIVNDHLDIALGFADGVHLGQDDLPVTAARKIVPSDFIIGVSVHNVEEAQLAQQHGADYLGVGCLFETQTKKDISRLTLEKYKQIINSVQIPVCAIGGVTLANLKKLHPPPDMAAMHAAIWQDSNPTFLMVEANNLLKENQRFKR